MARRSNEDLNISRKYTLPDSSFQALRLQRETDFLKCIYCFASRPNDPHARHCTECGQQLPQIPQAKLTHHHQRLRREVRLLSRQHSWTNVVTARRKAKTESHCNIWLACDAPKRCEMEQCDLCGEKSTPGSNHSEDFWYHWPRHCGVPLTNEGNDQIH